ncbi:hypothetical protein T484DRAFT_1786563 [Baffinella frigidus]|nr:hypothetical protein T484DRAFT_1786563 [Cryptophyta sp. CCMP2293]
MAVYTIKFMFADATTVSETFDTGSNIHDAKLKIIAAWPAGKDPVAGPEDLKMIHGGKVLDNLKTFEDYKVPQRQQVIMHLQPTPPNIKQEPR